MYHNTAMFKGYIYFIMSVSVTGTWDRVTIHRSLKDHLVCLSEVDIGQTIRNGIRLTCCKDCRCGVGVTKISSMVWFEVWPGGGGGRGGGGSVTHSRGRDEQNINLY